MISWSPDELQAIGDADEITVGEGDRHPVPIWVVRVDGRLFVRSFRGTAGAWYRRAARAETGRLSTGSVIRDVRFAEATGDGALQDRIDDAYRHKYGAYPTHVAPMVADQARATTLELCPGT